LQCADLNGSSRILRICEAYEEKIGTDSEPTKRKLRVVVRFEEFPEYPMIFNPTNARNAAKILQSDDTDKWIGKQLLVYIDHNVSYGGKTVDGLRVKAPPTRATQPAELSDDVPF